MGKNDPVEIGEVTVKIKEPAARKSLAGPYIINNIAPRQVSIGRTPHSVFQSPKPESETRRWNLFILDIADASAANPTLKILSNELTRNFAAGVDISKTLSKFIVTNLANPDMHQAIYQLFKCAANHGLLKNIIDTKIATQISQEGLLTKNQLTDNDCRLILTITLELPKNSEQRWNIFSCYITSHQLSNLNLSLPTDKNHNNEKQVREFILTNLDNQETLYQIFYAAATARLLKEILGPRAIAKFDGHQKAILTQTALSDDDCKTILDKMSEVMDDIAHRFRM
jgi:hypothetical protein